MRLLICSLVLSGIVLVSGCVVVPGDRAGLGFWGPIPAIYVPDYHGRYDGGRGYDDRGYDRRRYEDGGRYDGRSRGDRRYHD